MQSAMDANFLESAQHAKVDKFDAKKRGVGVHFVKLRQHQLSRDESVWQALLSERAVGDVCKKPLKENPTMSLEFIHRIVLGS